MRSLEFSVRYKSVKIRDNDIISFPNSSSTTQGHESVRKTLRTAFSLDVRIVDGFVFQTIRVRLRAYFNTHVSGICLFFSSGKVTAQIGKKDIFLTNQKDKI